MLKRIALAVFNQLQLHHQAPPKHTEQLLLALQLDRQAMAIKKM